MVRIQVLFILLFATTAQAQLHFTERGKASYYADRFENRRTASGELYRHKRLTAAHRTLPLGTQLIVTNLENDKSVVVRVNDRGPYIRGRIIDLSKKAMEHLGGVYHGVIEVQIETIRPREKISFSKQKSRIKRKAIPNKMVPEMHQLAPIPKPKKSDRSSFWRSILH